MSLLGIPNLHPILLTDSFQVPSGGEATPVPGGGTQVPGGGGVPQPGQDGIHHQPVHDQVSPPGGGGVLSVDRGYHYPVQVRVSL